MSAKDTETEMKGVHIPSRYEEAKINSSKYK